MSPSDTGGPPTGAVRKLTVALLREAPGADAVEVGFYESARFYRLPRRGPDFDSALRRLRASQTGGCPLRITFAAEHDDTITAVEECSGAGHRGAAP